MPIGIVCKSGSIDVNREFPDDKTLITVGRSPTCDITFPEEFAVVGHEHFALQRGVGEYKFVINSHHRVFADGKDVLDGTELNAAREIRLGTLQGPRILLEPRKISGANIIATAPQGESRTVVGMVQSSQHWMHLIVPVVVVLAVALGYMLYQPDPFAFGKRGDFSDFVEKYGKSVFLVDEIDSGRNSVDMATAWVVRLPDGSKAFASNAHVAALLVHARANGNTLVVRSPEKDAGKTHREYKIVDTMVHPGNAAFDKVKKETYAKAASGSLIKLTSLAEAYDVAILIPDSQDGLPEPLTVASASELENLHSGQPLAMIGYPAEGLVNFSSDDPAVTFQVGIVTAVRSFFLTNDAEAAQFVEHSIPATGGASGSPIFNENGHVVALLSGGNNFSSDKGRIPNAAMVNFAQRADLLVEVMEGKAEERLAVYRKQWTEAIAAWTRPPSDIASGYASAFKNEVGQVHMITLAGKTGSPDGRFGNASTDVQTVDLNGNTPLLLTAYAASGTKIGVAVWDPATNVLARTETLVGDSPLSVVYITGVQSTRLNVAVFSIQKNAAGEPDPTRVQYSATLYEPQNPQH